MKTSLDYYEILGVSSSATVSDVQVAYRRRVQEIRPDIRLDETTRGEFERLQEARDVLLDPLKRADYDSSRFSASWSGVFDVLHQALRGVDSDIERIQRQIREQNRDDEH